MTDASAALLDPSAPPPAAPPPVAPPVAPPAAPPVASANWFDGADAETVGHIQTKGWHIKPANEAALEAIKAHREAEKYLGAGVDKLVRIPDPNDPAQVKAFRDKLGIPADVTGYDLSLVKTAAGAAPDAAFLDFAKAQAADLGLSKDGAVKLAQAMLKQTEDTVTSRSALETAALAQEQAKLATNWGANAEANAFVAKQAAAKLGVTAEQINALEKVVGYAATMELFRTIGTKIGEDRFVVNPNPAIPGVMSREQAVSKKAQLMGDQAWVSRYMAGGAAEANEMKALSIMIVGEDDSRYSA